jgi:hypothetical protein
LGAPVAPISTLVPTARGLEEVDVEDMKTVTT